MKKEEKSKLKFNIILSLIGLLISLIFLILEILIIKQGLMFWIAIAGCNLLIFLGNYYEYKKMK